MDKNLWDKRAIESTDSKNTVVLYVRRAAIVLLAFLIVAGVMDTYFADWSLKAALNDVKAGEPGNIVEAEEIMLDEVIADDQKHDQDSEEQSGSAEEAADNELVSEPDEILEIESGEEESANPERPSVESEPAPEEAVTEESKAETVVTETLAEVIYEGEDYTVTISDPMASLPGDTELRVEEILPDSEEYKLYAEQARSTVSEENGEELGFARFFDITLISDGKEFEPENPVSVSITFGRKMQNELAVGDDESVRVLHFTENEKTGDIDTEIIDDRNVDVKVEKEKLEEAVFEAESFSVYGVISTVIEKNILASDGHNYKVTVSYAQDAGIPSEAELEVEEILKGAAADASGATYEEYVSRAEEALGIEEGSSQYVRLFDITITDGKGKKIEPLTPVNVKIELADKDTGKTSEENTHVLHFADEAAVPEVIESAGVNGDTVSFETGSFSVYAIVEAPEPATVTVRNAESVADLPEGEALYLSYDGTKKYVSNVLNGSKAFIEVNNYRDASEWFLEKAGDDGSGQFYIYTLIGEEKMYITNPSGNNAGLDSSSKMAFTISEAAAGKFYLKVSGKDLWLQHSKSGNGIRYYTDTANAVNSQFTITYVSSYSLPDDVYGLDGKTYGIAYHDESITSAALTTEGKTVNKLNGLAAKDMLMRPDVLDNDGVLLVAENSDIREWTFHSVEKDKYYITTTVDGAEKYLTIRSGNVTLEDTPDETCSVITAMPGTGTNSGKWHFTANNYSLNLYGGASGGFNAATGNGNTTWMNLVVKSNLTDNDFHQYNARKVSVSDEENVYNMRAVVIYTRVWNDTTKRYEFYAVDHDGSLIRCYDTGDSIEWIGSMVNKAMWELTEGHDEDGSLNYYYYLRNTIDGTYLVPQRTSGKVIYESSEPEGTEDFNASVNLNGRRYGENYTTIISWDDDQYSYSGLKVENGKVVACPLEESDDFYFAILDDPASHDELTTVKTIDSDAYGITMKMINFNNIKPGATINRDPVQNPFFGGDNNKPGLLTNSLGENGYPDTTEITGASQSLGNLFNDMTDVNHLFIESIYNESGYFEYDSTSNFAHLNEDGTFTVYDQLAAIGNENGNTRAHGQFMPYNEIEPGKLSTTTNRTTVTQAELPDTNPRKGEKLYLIDDPDYFFGMEMEAGFTQTANGLDAWGHDIIFEFSGDDDFWLYVDGELILDLGGVHPAMTGSINFRTGEVKSSRGNSTLYDLFRSNYMARGMSESEANAKLGELFETKIVNGMSVNVFKDYSNHSMKMFYMERGAGASNLHMKFNLAAVKPGTFVLTKKLAGTDNAANDLIEFPYQIFYKTKSDGDKTEYHLLGDIEGEAENVKYQGTGSNVKYAESFTPAGSSVTYSNVFFLKAGESAEVALPENTRDYYVKECGINSDVYKSVSANGTVLSGTAPDGSGSGEIYREDYAVEPASLEDRSQVDYVNEVDPEAMRSLHITKRLYDSDGTTRLSYDQDNTLFTFRLYLGNENTDPSNLPLANLYSYYVKDSEGNYCRWDADNKKFSVVMDGGSAINEYSVLCEYLAGLTSSERESIVFKTSMNGSISKIPADYTVEVRDLIVDTRYKVEERDREIPKGYTIRLEDGYTEIIDGTEHKKGTTPVSSVVEVGKDPDVEVRNQKGWGLTVKKIWTDRDFMEYHDPIHFAVYVKEGEGSRLLEDTVREMNRNTSKQELYYFFGNLQSGTPFSDYFVREVNVTPEGEVIPIEPEGKLTIGGKPYGGEYRDSYDYKVTYKIGEQTTHNENVRTDEVTNSRPGIRLLKTDWAGNPLGKAVFTLKDSEGNNVAASSYTSDAEDGLITTAYLNAGTYSLNEVNAPSGYISMNAPMEITVDEDENVTVSGVDEEFYMIDHDDASMAASITVKNRPVSLRMTKVDAENAEVTLAGVHFALYKQVEDTDGNMIKDYQPISGYEDLVTNDEGVLEAISMELGAGTYYLTETRAAAGYELLGGDVCFTISKNGTVSLNNIGTAYGRLVESKDDETGMISYNLIVSNGRQKVVRIRKISAETREVLPGASFEIYSKTDYESSSDDTKPSPITSGTTDASGLWLIGSLPVGEYVLVETSAPGGYNELESAVDISVRADTVTAMSRSGITVYKTEHYEDEDVWEIEIENSAGYELPSTGGPGTRIFHITGIIMLIASSFMRIALRGLL